MTKFDTEPKGSYERIYECVSEAIDDADMRFDEIEAVFVSNGEPNSNGERQKHIGPWISSIFKRQLPIITVPAGCGGGGVAFWDALQYQKKEQAHNVLALGFEKLVAGTSQMATDEMLMGGERLYEQAEGVIFPAQNALVAQQYMYKYGATIEDLSLVALKNHENAFLNPKARFFGKKVTMEMIEKSPIVASPLRLFDCSIPCNGAASVIITCEETDIQVAGSGLSTSRLSSFERDDMTTWHSTIQAAKVAYGQASVSAPDIDIVEIHDAFTPVELISYEDLGFASKGKGNELIRTGQTQLNGKIPVNTSGGLKAKGHPISATGLSQIYELVKQMRKQAEKRQVDGIRYAMAHNIGGAGSITSVHIFKAI